MPKNCLFDSNEELYFSWWLDELKEKEFILSYEIQPQSFELLPPVSYINITEKKLKDKSLLRNLSYTPDFKIIWHDFNVESIPFAAWLEYDEGTNKYCTELQKGIKPDDIIIYQTLDNKLISYIDIKGSFAGRNNNSAITFPLNKKLMFNRHGIFVNKIIPQKLFENTFVPKRYLLTDKNKQLRKINFNVKTIDDVF